MRSVDAVGHLVYEDNGMKETLPLLVIKKKMS
jgi:hypothetical protein